MRAASVAFEVNHTPAERIYVVDKTKIADRYDLKKFRFVPDHTNKRYLKTLKKYRSHFCNDNHMLIFVVYRESFSGWDFNYYYFDNKYIRKILNITKKDMPKRVEPHKPLRFIKPVVFDLENNKLYIYDKGEYKEMISYYDEDNKCVDYELL